MDVAVEGTADEIDLARDHEDLRGIAPDCDPLSDAKPVPHPLS
jgi:hypothetical protein